VAGDALPVEEGLARLEVALGERGASAVVDENRDDNREQQRDEADGNG
jgi:hypothetical protein